MNQSDFEEALLIEDHKDDQVALEENTKALRAKDFSDIRFFGRPKDRLFFATNRITTYYGLYVDAQGIVRQK